MTVAKIARKAAIAAATAALASSFTLPAAAKTAVPADSAPSAMDAPTPSAPELTLPPVLPEALPTTPLAPLPTPLPTSLPLKPYTIALDAAVFETWVITKYGATIAYRPSPENQFELEYLRGSLGVGYFGVSLGRIEEQKASLLWRSYGRRKSFSFFTGLTYNTFTVHLGSDFLETVSGSQRTNVDVAEFSTLAATWGFGQRWHSERGLQWGVDWFTISWPFVQLHENSPFAEASTSADKRSQFTNAAKSFKRIPSVGVLKLQLGYSF